MEGQSGRRLRVEFRSFRSPGCAVPTLPASHPSLSPGTPPPRCVGPTLRAPGSGQGQGGGLEPLPAQPGVRSTAGAVPSLREMKYGPGLLPWQPLIIY